MKTPHIAKLLQELENIATADFKKWSEPHATAEDFVVWAQSRATFTINEVNAAIAQESAEQATQNQLITAEQARALGAGNAEYIFLGAAKWMTRTENCCYLDTDVYQYKYRAIKKEVPAEPQVAAWPTPHEKVEPHAELRRLYAQQVKDGTLGNFDWTYKYNLQNTFVPLDASCFVRREFVMYKDHDYQCVPKLTCEVRNDDTGEVKTMTREAAKLLQAETKDVCDWRDPSGVPHHDWCFDFNGIYTYKLKALKPMSWQDMPVGVMTDKGEFRGAYTAVDGNLMLDIESANKNGVTLDSQYPKDIRLAPADQQNWIAVQGTLDEDGDISQDFADGLLVGVHPSREKYRVVGIADGWELK